VGTSTGAIIAAGIGSGLSAGRMTELYKTIGSSVFPHSLRSLLFPLTRYRYPAEPLVEASGVSISIFRVASVVEAIAEPALFTNTSVPLIAIFLVLSC
jgi:hypothetical protein